MNKNSKSLDRVLKARKKAAQSINVRIVLVLESLCKLTPTKNRRK